MGCCGSSERFACQVVVVKATGLPDVDIRGKCDPFVKVTVDGCDDSQKTERKENEQEPEWNQTLTFEEVRVGTKIMFEVYDWDRVTSNDLIGSIQISEDLPKTYGEEKELQLNLIKDGETDRGTLTVKVTFIHENPE